MLLFWIIEVKFIMIFVFVIFINNKVGINTQFFCSFDLYINGRYWRMRVRWQALRVQNVLLSSCTHTLQYCNKCRKCIHSFRSTLYNKTRQYRSSNLMSNITLYYNFTPVPVHLSCSITWSPTLWENKSSK